MAYAGRPVLLAQGGGILVVDLYDENAVAVGDAMAAAFAQPTPSAPAVNIAAQVVFPVQYTHTI